MQIEVLAVGKKQLFHCIEGLFCYFTLIILHLFTERLTFEWKLNWFNLDAKRRFHPDSALVELFYCYLIQKPRPCHESMRSDLKINAFFRGCFISTQHFEWHFLELGSEMTSDQFFTRTLWLMTPGRGRNLSPSIFISVTQKKTKNEVISAKKYNNRYV